MKKSVSLTPKTLAASSVAADTLLAAVKLTVGVLGSSRALISDGIHSCADIFSSAIVLLGSLLSRRENHGRLSARRVERASLFVLSSILFTSGVFIGLAGACSIASVTESQIEPPSVCALWVSVFALAIKETMFCLTMRTAKREGDDLLLANAWHHQSDALSCLGSFFGILMAKLGYPKLDSVASVAICFFVIKTAVDIFKRAIKPDKKTKDLSDGKDACVQNKQN